MELACAAYAIARELPPEERGSLGEQLRRSALSIPANIAEGHSRLHRKEFIQFLSIAHGSLSELETHLVVAEAVGYASHDRVTHALRLADETGRMLTVLRARLTTRGQGGVRG